MHIQTMQYESTKFFRQILDKRQVLNNAWLIAIWESGYFTYTVNITPSNNSAVQVEAGYLDTV